MGRPSTKPRGAYGQHLAELREAAGLTQKALAERLGVHHSNIAFWERWDKPPRGEVIAKLAAIFGITLEELLAIAPAPLKQPVPKGQLQRVFAEASKLPRRQQEKLAEFVQLFIAQHSNNRDKAA